MRYNWTDSILINADEQAAHDFAGTNFDDLMMVRWGTLNPGEIRFLTRPVVIADSDNIPDINPDYEEFGWGWAQWAPGVDGRKDMADLRMAINSLHSVVGGGQMRQWLSDVEKFVIEGVTSERP